MKFGQIIKREREKKEMTLQKLADYINQVQPNAITSSYLSRLESGDKDNPTFRLVCLIIKVLDLDLDEVLASFDYEELIGINQEEVDIDKLINISNIKWPKIETGEMLIEGEIIGSEEKKRINHILISARVATKEEGSTLLRGINNIIEDIGEIRDAYNQK